MFVGRDMGVFQPHLAITDNSIGAAQVHLALTNRLDFGSHQCNTRFDCALDEVIVIGLAIDGNHLDWLIFGGDFSCWLCAVCFAIEKLLFMDVYLSLLTIQVLRQEHCMCLCCMQDDEKPSPLACQL